MNILYLKHCHRKKACFDRDLQGWRECINVPAVHVLWVRVHALAATGGVQRYNEWVMSICLHGIRTWTVVGYSGW